MSRAQSRTQHYSTVCSKIVCAQQCTTHLKYISDIVMFVCERVSAYKKKKKTKKNARIRFNIYNIFLFLPRTDRISQKYKITIMRAGK